MKGKLIIGESTDYSISQTEVYVDENDYIVSINVPLKEDFISLISKAYDFDEVIELDMQIQSEEPEKLKILEDFKQNRLEYLKDAEYIIFKATPNEIAEYIRKNPILQTKKILFEIGQDLNTDFVNEIAESFGDNTSNIYFDVYGNSNLITFSEYKATNDALANMINEIEKFNLSPMEKIMYAYDIVRNKVYVEVDENENKMLSRNLSSALLGDKIVCVGYAVIFKTLLKMLGIECEEIKLFYKDKTGGHIRNLIYIQDEKYGIDGIYYFDPTWGSKKKENDNKYLYSYKYFAMTKETMDKLDEGKYIDENMPYSLETILSEFEDKFNKFGWEKMPRDIINQINYISYLLNGDRIIKSSFIFPFTPKELKPTKQSIIEKTHGLLDYFDRPIKAETMLQILYNVRKVQFYTTPDKFPFGINEFFETVIMSRWEFNGTPLENFMIALTTGKEKIRIQSTQFINYIQKNDLERKIEEVKLTRVLKNIYEEKSRKSR